MKKRIKHSKIWYIVFGLLGVIVLIALIFMRFGGFSTGENTNLEEFEKYAQSVEDITIPENAKIIALGEATHQARSIWNNNAQPLSYLQIKRPLAEPYPIRILVG